MLDINRRIEDLKKSAAECDLLALLIYDPVKRVEIRQVARNLKLVAWNLTHTPPSDGSPPFAQAVRPPPLGLVPAVAGFARAA